MTWDTDQMTFDAAEPAWDAASWIAGSDAVFPDPADVRLGVDRGDGTIGTLVVPSVANVVEGVTVDSGVGTYHAPSESEVIDTAVFGDGASTAGTFAVPDVAVVNDGEQYGADGTQYTGTLIATGGGDATEAKQDAILAAIANVPSVDQISDRIERDGGPLDSLIGKFAGITLVGSWLRAAFRKDAASAVAISEINTGGGTYDETTDSLEAIRDKADTIVATGLTGPHALAFTLVAQDGDLPIENAVVRLFRPGHSESRKTDDSGIVEFAVESATWSYAIDAEGFDGQTGQIEVDDDLEREFEMVASSAGAGNGSQWLG